MVTYWSDLQHRWTVAYKGKEVIRGQLDFISLVTRIQFNTKTLEAGDPAKLKLLMKAAEAKDKWGALLMQEFEEVEGFGETWGRQPKQQ